MLEYEVKRSQDETVSIGL